MTTHETENTSSPASAGAPGQSMMARAPQFDEQTGEPLADNTPLPTPAEVLRHQAAMKTIEQSKRQHLSTTRPGGAYLTADGVYIDSSGAPIDATPEEIEAEIKALRDAQPPKRM
jgi:hypothetical protein